MTITAIHRYRLEPATPRQRDDFVEEVTHARARRGGTSSDVVCGELVGAFFCNADWYSEIVHVSRFAYLDAFASWSERRQRDPDLARLDALAPQQSIDLYSPVGPIADAALDTAIERGKAKPAGVYTFALLDVRADRMDDFAALFSSIDPRLPIIAALRPLTGNTNRVLDIWRGDTERGGYQPDSDELDAFFAPLRDVAPRELVRRHHPLPYSPLQ